MAFGGGAFRTRVGHASGALMNASRAPIKETLETPPIPSTVGGHCKKMADYSPESELSPDTNPSGVLVLDQTSRTVRNKCLLFMSHPVYDIFYSNSEGLRHIGLKNHGSLARL